MQLTFQLIFVSNRSRDQLMGFAFARIRVLDNLKYHFSLLQRTWYFNFLSSSFGEVCGASLLQVLGLGCSLNVNIKKLSLSVWRIYVNLLIGILLCGDWYSYTLHTLIVPRILTLPKTKYTIQFGDLE